MTMVFRCSAFHSEERPNRLAEAFASLQEGTGLVVHATQPQVDLLHGLQDLHPRACKWHTLAERPGAWYALVARRGPDEPTDQQILEFMRDDHLRVHALIQRIVTAAENGRFDRLADTIDILGAGLDKHFEMEESLLFPVIELKLGADCQPLIELKQEHAQFTETVQIIRDLLARLSEDATQKEKVTHTALTLQRLLRQHSTHEESFLYSVADLLLDDLERASLVRVCQRM